MKKYFVAVLVLAGTLLATGASLYAQSKSPSPAASGGTGAAAAANLGPKWEYLTLVRSRQWTSPALGVVGAKPGWSDWETTINDAASKTLPLSEALNQLGSQGWELVSTSHLDVVGSEGTQANRVYLIFKRQKR